MTRLGRLLLVGMVCGLAVCAMAGATAAVDEPAEEPAPEIAGLRVGFAGRYKVGLWAPVEVTLRATDGLAAGRLRLTVPDADGVPSSVFAPVQPGQTSARCCVRFGRVEGDLTAELFDGERLVARRRFKAANREDAPLRPAVPATRRLIVCIGSEPMGVEEALVLSGGDSDRRPAVARLDDCGPLPTKWYGYEGVDLVVVSTSRPEPFRKDRLGAEQIDALNEWVRLGGKLVLCAASQAETLLAPGGPFGRFAPGRIEGTAVLRQTGVWESYAESTEPLARAGPGGARLAMRVPQLAGVEGVVELREAGSALVVRTPRGFGQVVFVAADLDLPPLDAWIDRPALVQKLLDLPAGAAEETARGSAVMHFGYPNIAGQLRSALDQFSEVRLLPFSIVAGLMVVYVLLIGVGDYFFLRKVVRRMRWTWLTFPAVVLGVCVAAYFLAYGLRGDRVRLNQVDLLDVDAASGRIRATSWMNVFSPGVELYDLSVRPQLPGGRKPQRAEVLLSWLGLPGAALGGMDPQTAAFSQWTAGYDFAPRLDGLEGLPIQVWSSKSLTARWTAQWPEGSAVPVESDLAAEDRVPEGKVVQRLGFPLEDCLLAYRYWVFELGTLEPGVPRRVGPMVKHSELKTLLTGRKIVLEGKDYRQESTPYDQASRDLAYILRTMMFFEAAGGERYTGLTNTYQGFVDAEGLLTTGRAILVGRAPGEPKHRPTVLLRDGRPMTDCEDRHLSVYRFVLPVKEVP
jgi:hypothetical protein